MKELSQFKAVYYFLLMCILFSFVARTANAQSIFGANLILNGDAEAGAASNGRSAPGGIVPVTNWVTAGAFTINQYGQTNAIHVVPLTAPSSPARGTNFFSGGPTNGDSFATQELDVSAAASEIDSRIVRYCLAGYFGGFHKQNDNAVLTATFLDATGVALGTNSVGSVLAADRADNTEAGSLLLRKTQGAMPIGTRKVQFRLYMQIDNTIANQSYNDGYADNLSFVLVTPVDSFASLSIANIRNEIIVGWPNDLTGFNVQAAPQLQPPIVWNAITNSIGVMGGKFVLTNHPSSSSQFFRLVF